MFQPGLLFNIRQFVITNHANVLKQVCVINKGVSRYQVILYSGREIIL